MGKISCKCQCMECAHSINSGVTRACKIMLCVTKHCGECLKVMVKCKFYITAEELKKRQDEEKRLKAEEKKLKAVGGREIGLHKRG